MRSDLDGLAEQLGGLARPNVRIGARTTYRVGGRAALFVELSCDGDVERLATILPLFDVPLLLIGKGSNTLVSDAGWKGLCVRVGDDLAEIRVEGSGVTAGAGAAYPVLARRSAAAGLTGMEWAVGIPGSVGGAVRMNAGGHGAETAERLVSARVVDLKSGTESSRSTDELGLSYRRSGLGPADLVLEATFRLAQGDPAESARRIAEIVRWRRENQPGGQNAGSVFANPPDDSAGRLIDAAGLKGLRIGTACVSDKHANFIQADDGGSADDVRRLIDLVRKTVAERTGVELAVEVRLVGFAGAAS